MDCFAEFVAPWQWGPAVTSRGKQDFNNLSTLKRTNTDEANMAEDFGLVNYDSLARCIEQLSFF